MNPDELSPDERLVRSVLRELAEREAPFTPDLERRLRDTAAEGLTEAGGAPSSSPRQHRWARPLIAAAAVVAVVGGIVAVSTLSGRSNVAGPSGPPSTLPTAASSTGQAGAPAGSSGRAPSTDAASGSTSAGQSQPIGILGSFQGRSTVDGRPYPDANDSEIFRVGFLYGRWNAGTDELWVTTIGSGSCPIRVRAGHVTGQNSVELEVDGRLSGGISSSGTGEPRECTADLQLMTTRLTVPASISRTAPLTIDVGDQSELVVPPISPLASTSLANSATTPADRDGGASATSLSQALSRIAGRVARFGSPAADEVSESSAPSGTPGELALRQTWSVASPVETVEAWYHDRYFPEGTQATRVMGLTPHVDVSSTTTPLDSVEVTLYLAASGPDATVITVVVDGVAQLMRTAASMLDADDIASGSLQVIPNAGNTTDEPKKVTLTRADIATLVTLLNRAGAVPIVESGGTMGGVEYRLTLITDDGRTLRATYNTSSSLSGFSINFDPAGGQQLVQFTPELYEAVMAITGTR